MPTRSDLAAHRQHLKAEVARRAGTGETLVSICAEAGQPHLWTVYRWLRTDACFKDLLKDAQRRGVWRRRYGFDEAKARAFLARLAAGEPLAELARDPAMPAPSTLRYWRASQGEFGAEVLRLIGVHRAQRCGRLKPPRAARTRPWTEDEGDRILVRVGRGEALSRLHKLDPTLPERWLVDDWRRQSPEFAHDLRVHVRAGRKARARARRKAALEILCDRIVQGGSVHSLGGRHGLPASKTLYRWINTDPDFAREVARACDIREDWYRDKMIEVLDKSGPISGAEMRRRLAPLSRQLGSLKNRPGKRWAL